MPGNPFKNQCLAFMMGCNFIYSSLIVLVTPFGILSPRGVYHMGEREKQFLTGNEIAHKNRFRRQ